MKPKILLRIASIIMLLHVLGHTIGHSGWKQASEPEKTEVIKQMTEHKFPFMGTNRSMGEYYDGYGYASTLALLLLTSILWIASSAPIEQKALSIKILWITGICLLCWGIDELIFFFPFAASFSIVSGVLTLLAILQLRKQEV